jgi:hypothetical protein
MHQACQDWYYCRHFSGGDDYTPKRTKHKNGNSEPNFAIFFSFTNTNVTKINKSITKVLKNVNI